MKRWYPNPKKTQPGPDSPKASPLSVFNSSLFHRYRCSTLFNCVSNLSLCGISLIKLLPPLHNRGLLPTPKETYDLKLSAVTLRIWWFRTPTTIFCTKKWYNPGLLPSPLYSLHRIWCPEVQQNSVQVIPVFRVFAGSYICKRACQTCQISSCLSGSLYSV